MGTAVVVTFVVMGVLWVLTCLFYLFYGVAIREMLQKEAVYVRKTVDEWTSDPNYYKNKAGLKSPNNYNKKLQP